MARVMTLDGLGQARLAEIRAQLDQPIALQGLAPSTWPLWLWALLGVAGGAWVSARNRAGRRR